MRLFTTFLAGLPTIAIAQQQVPMVDKFQGWLNTAQEFVKNVAAVPIDKTTERVAKRQVQPITFGNWREILSPSDAAPAGGKPEEWMVYITGQNVTCFGLCDKADKTWDAAVTLLQVGLNDVHLGKINCEEEVLLCGAWAATCPSIWHFLIPKALPDQSRAPITIHQIPLNRTSVVISDITEIHTKQKYLDVKPYDGYLHPWDGIVAQLGLTMPMAYGLYYLSKIPSWLFMMVLTLISRTYMTRRVTSRRPPPGRPAAAAS